MMESHSHLSQLNQETNTETTFYSPTFKRYESVTFYANLLNILKQYASIVDRYQGAARRIIWTNIFQLLAQPQRPCDLLFSPVISSWLEEKSVDLMDIETYFTAFTQAQYQYPNIFQDFPPVSSNFSIPGISAPITSVRIPKSHLDSGSPNPSVGGLPSLSSQTSFHTQNPLHKQSPLQQPYKATGSSLMGYPSSTSSSSKLPSTPYQNIEFLKQQQQLQIAQQLQQQLRQQQNQFNFQHQLAQQQLAQQQQQQLQQLAQQQQLINHLQQQHHHQLQQQQQQQFQHQNSNQIVSPPPPPPLSYSSKNATVWSTELPSIFQQLSLLQNWSQNLQKLSQSCKELVWKTCSLFYHFTNYDRTSFLVTFMRWSKDPIPNLNHITIMFSAIGYLKEKGYLKGLELLYPQTNSPVFKEFPLFRNGNYNGNNGEDGSPSSSPSHNQYYDENGNLVDDDYDVDQYESGTVSDDERDLSPSLIINNNSNNNNVQSNSNTSSPRSTTTTSTLSNATNSAVYGLNNLSNSKKRKSTDSINDLAVAAVFSDSNINNNNNNVANGSYSSSSSSSSSPISTSNSLQLNRINDIENDNDSDKEEITKQTLHSLKRLRSNESINSLANSYYSDNEDTKEVDESKELKESSSSSDKEEENNNKSESSEIGGTIKKSKSMNINSILC